MAHGGLKTFVKLWNAAESMSTKLFQWGKLHDRSVLVVHKSARRDLGTRHKEKYEFKVQSFSILITSTKPLKP